MKLRYISLFLFSLLIVFGALNSAFILAYARYEFTSISHASDDVRSLPLAKNKTNVALPDQAQLVIPKLSVSAPIIFNIKTDPRTIFNNLQKGVVHYSSSVKPGENGLSVILGHSSAYPWYKGHYGSVFALLGKLSKNDTFYIRYSDGQTFSYAINRSIVFNPFIKDKTLDQLQTDDRSSVILVSCWPIGTNYRRIAIQALKI